MPYRRATRSRDAWWLTVLWSVTATTSRPAATPAAASSAMLNDPSECTVCVCRSHASQVSPAEAGRVRRLGRSGTGGGSGSASGGAVAGSSTSTSASRPGSGILCRPSSTAHVPGSRYASRDDSGRYPGVAAAGVMTNRSRAPPDQPRNPDGPQQPRSTTPAVRSYPRRTSTDGVRAGTSNGSSRYGDAARSSGVRRRRTVTVVVIDPRWTFPRRSSAAGTSRLVLTGRERMRPNVARHVVVGGTLDGSSPARVAGFVET